MTSKGLLAVSLFFVSMLVTNVSTITPCTIDWSHGSVVAGASMTVKVNAAACSPVHVTLYLNGEEIEGTVEGVPGEVTLPVPKGTQGQGYTIEIKCPDESVSETGQVI